MDSCHQLHYNRAYYVILIRRSKGNFPMNDLTKLVSLPILLLFTNCSSESLETGDIPDLSANEISALEDRAAAGDTKAVERLALDALATGRLEDSKRYNILGVKLGDCSFLGHLEDLDTVYKYPNVSSAEIEDLRISSKCP